MLTKHHEGEANPTPFKILMDQIYDAIKGQDFIRHPRTLPPNLKAMGAGEYCTFHDGVGHQTVDCCYLLRQLQELVD